MQQCQHLKAHRQTEELFMKQDELWVSEYINVTGSKKRIWWAIPSVLRDFTLDGVLWMMRVIE